MISLELAGCRIDILPVVQGLVAEADKVAEAFGDYDAYGLSVGPEGLLALENRAKAEDDDFEVSQIDLVYAKKMSEFGEVQFPSPAFCELVDLCKERSKGIIPLDMNEERFTQLYIDTVKVTEYVNEHRIAKKGLKKDFKVSSPEDLALAWDEHVNGVKGYRMVAEGRERYIAEQIREVAKYRKSLLAVIETERVPGIEKLLRYP